MTQFNKLILAFSLSLTGLFTLSLPECPSAFGQTSYYPDPNLSGGSYGAQNANSYNSNNYNANRNNTNYSNNNYSSTTDRKNDVSNESVTPPSPPPGAQAPLIIEPDGIPALNIVAPPERPPLPAPEKAAASSSSFSFTPSGKNAIKVESWRSQALKLQKIAGAKLDPLTTVRLEAQSNMASISAVLPEIASLNNAGVFLYAHAPAAGQALLLLYNADRNVTEKLYLVYLPSKTGTVELRAQCESKSKLLNQTKAQAILNLLKSAAEVKAHPQNLL